MVINREQLRGYVQNGADFLDAKQHTKQHKNLFNWRIKIWTNIKKLDLYSGTNCIMGILYGSYGIGEQKLDLDYLRAAVRGFTMTPDTHSSSMEEHSAYKMEYYHVLTELWVEHIEHYIQEIREIGIGFCPQCHSDNCYGTDVVCLKAC